MDYMVSNKEKKEYTRSELNGYVKKIGKISKEEKEELKKWSNSGNSVYENPYYMSDDDGIPMDYITAIRTMETLREEWAESSRNPEVMHVVECNCANNPF